MPDTSALHSASAALAAGRQVQSGRIRAISENLANADSVPTTPGGAPYARKIAVFAPVAADSPRDPVGRIARDTTGFRTRYDPTSPGADPSGYVRLPNVNSAVESADLQRVVRNYELSLSASASIKTLAQATINLIS
ncbi:flagellar basal-body rod protein FlgC [Methylobacterium sp. PvP062]|mgnify:FL=1|jgi:flagellar basal-body rod protein FlgC|uniref:Flagellar basal body rod protein FlgC n=2 Tax=Methylobacterium radiotolerans TaxID=31998 RepID=B1LZQ6_METRJ|nr:MULTISPECIES: flagellar basal body rod protein FlgC [Methylobacterium]MCX7332318.1 flagellar biosynthesis protein FlgC [Hyphomicrobiales bacterium]GAN49127.1 flagellar basal body rod protein FlgC [Methylobacterium sp. ME121]ACB22954.1 flagellar basal body rod protein FlgC [Methylobacterium radiotolerans JCM 2831]KTS00711.1 flagellar basal body rod protein FlgC [Methylobacterium radiotolerans]KTS43854.1 flagellar basal body rod protein FlgC [Methylobacterium radiotolerans]